MCSFVRTGGGYAPLEYHTGQSDALDDSEGHPSHAHTDSASHHRYRHRHSGSVKPGMSASLMQACLSLIFALLTRVFSNISIKHSNSAKKVTMHQRRVN